MATSLRRFLRSDRTTAPAHGKATKSRTPIMVEERRNRWRLRRRNPLSVAVWAVAIGASLPPLLGVLLTWMSANPGNPIVGTVLWVGGWLAAPFHAMFVAADPDRQLMLNWGIAGATYLLVGRLIAWLLRW